MIFQGRPKNINGYRKLKRENYFTQFINSSLRDRIFEDDKGVNCMSLKIVQAKKYFTKKSFLKLSSTED